MGLVQDILQEVPLSAVLRERVTLAEEKHQKAEAENAALRAELAEANAKVSSLGSQNGELRQLVATLEKTIGTHLVPENELDANARRVLVYLLNAEGDERDVAVMAERLGIKRSLAQFYLDDFKRRGWARLASSNYISGGQYWSILPLGRKYAVENGLDS